MQDFISTFASPFQFVNVQLYREEVSPHRHDCHDPPHAVGVGFRDHKSPPRRLARVARLQPWKSTLTTVGFPVDATRRGRLHWDVWSDRWNTGMDEDYLRRDGRGEDCHPEQAICSCAGLGDVKIEFEAFALACGPKGCLGS